MRYFKSRWNPRSALGGPQRLLWPDSSVRAVRFEMVLGLEFEDGQQFRGLKQQLRKACGLGLRLVDKPFHHLHEVGFQGLGKHEIEVRMQVVSRALVAREKHYWGFSAYPREKV